jgi:broad specificity phosphatase PhoE
MVEEIERAQRQDPLLEARLREMYGGDWDDWTDEDIDEMRRQMWHESAARKPDPAV